MDTHTLYLWAFSGSAIAATFVGVSGLGYNILKLIGLKSLHKEIQFIAGAAGLMALSAFFLQNDAVLTDIHATTNTLNTVVWFISAITTFCVGLAALKVNTLTYLKHNPYRKMLQYIVGAAGAYSLYLYFGT